MGDGDLDLGLTSTTIHKVWSWSLGGQEVILTGVWMFKTPFSIVWITKCHFLCHGDRCPQSLELESRRTGGNPDRSLDVYNICHLALLNVPEPFSTLRVSPFGFGFWFWTLDLSLTIQTAALVNCIFQIIFILEKSILVGCGNSGLEKYDIQFLFYVLFSFFR